MNNMDPSREPVIVAAVRTAVGRAKKGSLVTYRPDEMAVAVIQELLQRTPELDPAEIDDFILGCAFPEGEQGMNMARMVSLASGLPVTVPAETINRFCSSGLQSIAHAAYAIAAGQIEVAIAGGVACLITGNKSHFPRKSRQGIKILSPSEFIDFYRKNN